MADEPTQGTSALRSFEGSNEYIRSDEVTVPPIPRAEYDPEEYGQILDAFGLDDSRGLMSGTSSIDGDLHDLPPTDTAEWEIQHVTDTESYTSISRGTLPIEGAIHGVPIRIDQDCDAPVKIMLGDDSTIYIDHTEQVPLIIHNRLRVVRHAED